MEGSAEVDEKSRRDEALNGEHHRLHQCERQVSGDVFHEIYEMMRETT